jgi:phosphonate transport system permease protein
MSAVATDPHRDPAWQSRVFWTLAGLVLLAPALVAVEFKPWKFFEPDNLRVTLKFLADFLPPEVSMEFLKMVAKETWRTVAIASAAMVLALVLAIPLTLLSCTAISISAVPGPMHPAAYAFRQAVRALLVVLRSVPELVWALVFVRVVGLGAAAGVLAIALTYAGMLGKVYGEILESGELHPSKSLLANGSGRLQTFFYALLPSNARELTSYTVYRWECAIRSSAVLGFVGAGGLGQQLDASMKMFNGGEVATMLFAFVLLVALADLLSGRLRKMLG